MSTVLNFLAVVMLVAHASLGCCLHHTHPVQFGQNDITEHGCSCCLHDPSAVDDSLSQESDAPSGPCDEDTCQLVASPPTRAELDFGLFADAGWVDWLMSQSIDVPLGATISAGLALEWQPIAPPVRLHLLHQVLLT